MTTIRDLIEKVNEKNLTKDQLEAYHSDIVHVYGLFQEEIADIRKTKAVYFMDEKYDYDGEPKALPGNGGNGGSGRESKYIIKRSDKDIERMWAITEKGQREIEVSHWIKAVEKLLSSLKVRMYNVY